MTPVTKRVVAYVAHPIGQEPERAANLARARRWLRWLISVHPEIAFAVPWLPYTDVLDETPDNRERGIRDDIAMLQRCDLVVLVGGTISTGMAMEVQIAQSIGMNFIDYLHLGAEPPP